MKARTVVIIAFATFCAGCDVADQSPSIKGAATIEVTIDCLHALLEGLASYEIEYGRLPEPGIGLAAKFYNGLGHPNSYRLVTMGRARSGSEFVDAWGNPFRLEVDGAGHTVRSAGADGRYDTGDDLFLSMGPVIPPRDLKKEDGAKSEGSQR